MMSKQLLIVLVLSGLITSSCNNRNQEVVSPGMMGVQSLLWYQLSAEAEALCLQGYNIAGAIIRDSAATGSEKPLAVVLDIDETVLDNSPFNVEMLRRGETYSSELWAEWCERREAIAVPGALEFTKLATSLDIEVYYISNRHEELMVPTLDNMKTLGFPFADSAHVLLKNANSSKDARRASVSEHHHILLLIGDNLGDFDGLFDERTAEYGKDHVRSNSDQFGSRFILLPNPMYGSWERAVFPGGVPEEGKVLESLRGF